MGHILAIDQGTTSSRALVFDDAMHPIASAQAEFRQHFPRSGWVEHDPEEIWQTVLKTCREAMKTAELSPQAITAIGITNQRETTVLWDRRTGEAVHPAIVWQDRRTAGICAELREAGHEAMVHARTGLLLDPYFSGTKLQWLLQNVDGAQARAEAGELLFGTIDSYLIWRLTGGAVHATDATNASRTLLYDIHKGQWCSEICALLNIPMRLLPEVHDSAADYGAATPEHFGASIPIRGVAGDQQAATVGQACFQPGMLKSTYGTGCFALLNTGATPVTSQNRLLTTIAYQLNGKPTYALEGSIFVAGAVVQWLRDGLGVISRADETGELAANADDSQDVVIVPAFTGLGAPYWNAECRGAAFGLTRASGPAELARAALESVGYQTRDLLEAMRADWQGDAPSPDGYSEAILRVDGGMAVSDWTMQFLADISGAPVDRPAGVETTAQGAAWLAGWHAGLYPAPEEFAAGWALERRFCPQMDEPTRAKKYARWQRCVEATLAV